MKKFGKRIIVIMLVFMMVSLNITACSRSKKTSEVAPTPTAPVTSTEKSSTGSTSKKITQSVTEKEKAEETDEKAEEEITEEPKEIPAAEEEAPEGTEENAVHTSAKSSSSAINAFAKLLSGNTAFVSGNINPHVEASLREDLVANGQHPYAIVITCSDSRVPAELIFNAGLGEIFVIRTAGNVVSDFEIGSVEYGAEHLGSPLVLVLGHTNCGAVTAATEGGEAGGSIQAIVNEIAPSVTKAKESGASEEQLLSKAIELNVNNSINKIRQSHIMKELEEEGKVAILGGVYDIHTGNIKILD